MQSRGTSQMKHKARRNSGFVLITSLLVLVVVSALGAGALFLTMMNLRIAENARVGAVARYNAERGLDLALLSLAHEYGARGDGTWPTLVELRGMVPDSMTIAGVSEALQYDVLSLTISGDDPSSGVVEVEGRGGRDGAYRTSARFQGTFTEEPVFGVTTDFGGIGFVTPGQVIAMGNAKFGLDVHVGAGINATGRPSLIGSVLIRSATGTCSLGSGQNAIQCGINAPMPAIPAVDFVTSRASFAASRPICDVNITTDTVGYDVTTRPGQTICVADGVSLEVTGTATELYIIGEVSSTVTVRASADPPAGDATAVGLKVVAGTVIPASPGVMGVGTNTIISKSSINLERDVFAGQDGIVRTYVASEGDIRFAGAGGQELYGVFHANGDVCTQGTLSVFYGSILAGTNRSDGVDGLCDNFVGIDFRGNGGLDAFRRPVGAVNEDFPREVIGTEFVVGGLEVVSRQ